MIVLIALASLVWVPIGVAIGLRPQTCGAGSTFGAILSGLSGKSLIPLFVIPIVRFGLNTDVWLTPLMILGTQWYILFNVIAGTSVFPTDFLEAAKSFHFRRWQWWRIVILPGIFPYYITGAITASGGAWNASIVAEVVSWGRYHLYAHGLGALYQPGDRCRRLSAYRTRHRNDVGFRGSLQSPAVASTLWALASAGCGWTDRRRCARARRDRSATAGVELEIRHVRQTYARPSGAPLLVLDDINLTLHTGEIVALLGRSGLWKVNAAPRRFGSRAASGRGGALSRPRRRWSGGGDCDCFPDLRFVSLADGAAKCASRS